MSNYVSKMTVGGSTALIKDSEARDLISENTANITKNANNISINTTNIAKNTTDISKITTNISTNTANISKNTANISNNMANISNNMANITKNTADISTMNNKIESLNNHVNNKSNPHNVTAEQLGVAKSNIVDMIYPIGSIYMSINGVDPATLFGGRWEQIKGRFLLATDRDSGATSGGTYAPGSRGGTSYTTLEGANLPDSAVIGPNLVYSTTNNGTEVGVTKDPLYYINQAKKGTRGNPFTNMPPYLTVYMWQRTA